MFYTANIYLASIIILSISSSLLASPSLRDKHVDNEGGITYENIDENSYKLLLIKIGTSDPAIAQQLLQPTVTKLCGSEGYRLGKYTFNTTSEVDSENSESVEDKLFFMQEIHCGDKTPYSVTRSGNNTNWQPSDQDKSSAEQVSSMYLEAMNEGRFSVAYTFLTSGMQEMFSEDEWNQEQKEFQKESGGEVKYFNVRVTWYKDPQGAAYPGIYAAFDLDCQYKNISICSEVLILHKYKSDDFRVMRHERNYMDKETEKELGKPKKKKRDTFRAI